MKVHEISDTHNGWGKLNYRTIGGVPECNLIILAGDIDEGAGGWQWIEKTYGGLGVPVAYVPGNHEYYANKRSLKELNEHLKSKTHPTINFLQNDVLELSDHNTVVIGATFWTDFKLNGKQLEDMEHAKNVMNDYKYIRYDKNCLSAYDVLHEHETSYKFINETVKQYKESGWKTVVVTHHPPTKQSCSPKYNGLRDNVYFLNDIDTRTDFNWPDVWVHGHTHNSSCYEVNCCKVYANPRGYISRYTHQAENTEFNPTFTFEV